MKKKLMAMALAACAALGLLTGMTAYGDTLTVHDGTATNSRIPFDGYRFDQNSRAQVIYPAGALQGMIGQSIAAIRWYSSSPSAFNYSSQVAIYLKEENSLSTSAFVDTNTCTRVYTGTLSIVSDGTVTVILDTPFHYQGGNLIYVLNNELTGVYQTRSFLGQSVSGASLAQVTPSGSPEQQNFIPKTTFIYGSPVTVTYDLNYAGGETTNKTIIAGLPVLANAPEATREGWEFIGWYTAAEGGTKITATDGVTDGAIYYAHWVSFITIGSCQETNYYIPVNGYYF